MGPPLRNSFVGSIGRGFTETPRLASGAMHCFLRSTIKGFLMNIILTICRHCSTGRFLARSVSIICWAQALLTRTLPAIFNRLWWSSWDGNAKQGQLIGSGFYRIDMWVTFYLLADCCLLLLVGPRRVWPCIVSCFLYSSLSLVSVSAFKEVTGLTRCLIEVE